MKRKIQPAQPVAQVVKKFRSKRHRRRRSKISPILCSDEKARLVSLPFPVDSTASSHLTREFSCDSSRIPVTKPGNSQKKRSFEEITGFGESSGQNRIVTRSYYRRREKEKKNEDVKEEISESSCVESCSAADAAETISNLTSSRGKGIEDSESSKNNKAACAEKISGKAFRKLFKSGGVKERESQKSHETKACEVAHISNQAENYDEIRITKVELPAVSNFNTIDPGLVCSELLCDEVASDYSSAFSDLRSEIFQQSSEIDLSSDYTPSIWLESGSEFSQRSVGDSSPSPTFSLFLQYSQQFCASTFSLDSKFSSSFEDDCSNECRSLKFEDEEHEMSYQMLRKRERKEIYMQDYAEEYCSTTEYGGLVIQQRLQMVHWIVEQSTSKELQKETMFLGVSLLDRFLSTGFFKNKRELQIVGIACLALATRLEENQPFNSVRKKMFCVGSNTYSRCEVVAMEWLVQEVLNFQCFLPTIYNFLWFYLQAAKANEVVEKTAKYLAVLALLGHEQLCFWPSTVAAGLVILASLVANQDESCIRVMETHIRSKEDDLPCCIKSLEWLVKHAC